MISVCLFEWTYVHRDKQTNIADTSLNLARGRFSGHYWPGPFIPDDRGGELPALLPGAPHAAPGTPGQGLLAGPQAPARNPAGYSR